MPTKPIQRHRDGALVPLSRADVSIMEAQLHTGGKPAPPAFMPRLGPVETPESSDDDADYDDDTLLDTHSQEAYPWD